MRGALSSGPARPDELVDIARASPSYVGRDLVKEVTTTTPYRFTAGGDGLTAAPSGPAIARVAAIDFGLKRRALELLAASRLEVTVVPATTPARTLLDDGYDGVFLSNGPGDPGPLSYAVATVASLLGRVPLFGICLGHQLLALSLGARTYKLRFGHRGANHPVRRIGHRRVEITSQNHGFAVERNSLAATGAQLTHVNLNDRTVEGIELSGAAFGVQYHPEAAPGPHDSRYLFDRFVDLMDSFGGPTPVARRRGASGEVAVRVTA
jgi:carbamoyl-phosphate synthase small subunit